MGHRPPPTLPRPEELARRWDAGARTFRELDPAFAGWLDGRDRFYGWAWPVLVAGGVAVVACVVGLACR